jgi:hypothetical protein
LKRKSISFSDNNQKQKKKMGRPLKNKNSGLFFSIASIRVDIDKAASGSLKSSFALALANMAAVFFESFFSKNSEIATLSLGSLH